MGKTNTVSWTKKLLQQYEVPTVLKEKLLRPYFEKTHFKGPILDVGSGSGYFFSILKKRRYNVTGIEKVATDSAEGLLKKDILRFKSNKKFKSILLINLLTTVDRKNVLPILRKVKSLLASGGKIYIVTMNAELYHGKSESQNLTFKKTSKTSVYLKFKQTNGSFIAFNDFIIHDAEISRLITEVGLKIMKKEGFKEASKAKAIYNLYILKEAATAK